MMVDDILVKTLDIYTYPFIGYDLSRICLHVKAVNEFVTYLLDQYELPN